VHAAVAQETQQMQTIALCFALAQRIEQNRITIESPLVDVFVDEGEILIYDPAGAENHVPDLRIAHLAVGQSDVSAGHGQAGIRVIFQERVKVRRGSAGDCVAFLSWIDTESIQDDEKYRRCLAQSFSFPVPADAAAPACNTPAAKSSAS
jgi:hypothetical protein